MMGINLKKDHVFLQATAPMQRACSQLSKIGLSYFERFTIDANGYFSMISNNSSSNERILAGIEPGELNFDFSKLTSTRYTYSEDLIKTIPSSDRAKALEKIKTSRNDFDICNLFQIINIQDGRYESFVFGSSVESEMDRSEYFNKLPDLENFLLWFKSSHMQLIKSVDENSMQLNSYKPNLGGCSTWQSSNQVETQQGIPSPARYYFNHRDDTKYLTRREYQVFSHLFRGYKHKEVAELLSISPRTIDSLISACLRRNNIPTVGKMIDFIMHSELKHGLFLFF
jgi:DNA-binding CsgD family transcriptional regulator